MSDKGIGMKVYKVELETHYYDPNLCIIERDGEVDKIETNEGFIYVATDDPRVIYERFGDKVISVRYVGPAYVVMRRTHDT